MKTLVTIEIENEIGNPSVEDIRLFIEQIIEKGFIGKFDIHSIISKSSMCLRILEIKKENDKSWSTIPVWEAGFNENL